MSHSRTCWCSPQGSSLSDGNRPGSAHPCVRRLNPEGQVDGGGEGRGHPGIGYRNRVLALVSLCYINNQITHQSPRLCLSLRLCLSPCARVFCVLFKTLHQELQLHSIFNQAMPLLSWSLQSAPTPELLQLPLSGGPAPLREVPLEQTRCKISPRISHAGTVEGMGSCASNRGGPAMCSCL